METGRIGALPYEALYAPLLASARERLAHDAGTALSALAPAALASCERALLTRLSRLGFRALEFECSLWRGEIQLAALLAGSAAPVTAPLGQTQDLEADFTRQITRRQAASPLDKYPVLVRLLSQVTGFWVDSTVELCQRLARDRTAIERVFGSPADRVVSVDCCLSDPHHGSRFVTSLAFESGLRVIYKPRSLGLERAYYTLVAWMGERSSTLPLRVVATLDRHDYGWMEYVEPFQCADEGEAHEYFRRAGAHLCLLYILGGADLHSENLIAAGPDPVPIDLEVLMRPSLAGRDVAGAGSWQQIAWELEQSVLSTGLLPEWMPAGGGRAVNLGGLGGPASDAHPAASAPPDADRAYAARRMPDAAVGAASRQNRPTLLGRPLDVVDYRRDLVDGFARTYDLAAAHAADLLRADGPLASFRGQRLRYVHRPTTVYVKGIQQSLGLEELESADVRAAGFDRFFLAARMSADQAPALQQIARAEIAAMAQLDVPYFRGSVDARGLWLPDGTTVEDYFTRSGFESSEDRIRGLSPEDRDRQCALMDGALTAVGLRAHGLASADRAPARAAGGAATPGDLLEESYAIARQLRDSAIRSAGRVAWLGPQLMPHSDRFHFSPLGPSLYDGATGVALFLAAVGRVTGERPWRDLALSALRPLLTALSAPGLPITFTRTGGGLGVGWGGVVYGLVRCARLLDSSECREAALGLLDRSASAFTSHERRADVMFGDAGAILGVLALYEETGEARALELAIRLGQRLLDQRDATGDGLRSWQSDGGFLGGFSHGAAGCVSALARLSRIADRPELRAAIADGLAFEDRAPPVPMCAWCHGAPGVLLARLDCRLVVDSVSGQRDIDRTIVALTTAAAAPFDQCCCGNAGRLDILQLAGDRLGRPALRDRALLLAAEMIDAARERGYYACIGERGAVQSPGLFQGLAGIGYTLLRLAKPRELPSFLGVHTA